VVRRNRNLEFPPGPATNLPMSQLARRAVEQLLHQDCGAHVTSPGARNGRASNDGTTASNLRHGRFFCQPQRESHRPRRPFGTDAPLDAPDPSRSGPMEPGTQTGAAVQVCRSIAASLSRREQPRPETRAAANSFNQSGEAPGSRLACRSTVPWLRRRQRKALRKGSTLATPDCSMRRNVSVPITAMSALPRRKSTSSRSRTPKPTASGSDVARRQRTR
jgi:hypothetical protein